MYMYMCHINELSSTLGNDFFNKISCVIYRFALNKF